MTSLVRSILEKRYDDANSILSDRFTLMLEKKLLERKKMIASEMADVELSSDEPLPSVEKKRKGLTEARIKIIKARIRNGKVQRRKKVSNVQGFTFRGGKLTRMSPAERRKRKLGAKRAKIKTRAKMGRILMKRKRSLARRKSMGL